MSDKPIWVVSKVDFDELQNKLNELSNSGYHIFKIECIPRHPLTPEITNPFMVIAVDPVHMMKGIQSAQMSIQADAMEQLRKSIGLR